GVGWPPEIVGIRTLLCSSHFSHKECKVERRAKRSCFSNKRLQFRQTSPLRHGSTLSHLNNNLLHLHMMNTTMNRQQRKTIHTDMNSMMISLQHHNLILWPNLKPKTTNHSQKQNHSHPSCRNSPLSIVSWRKPRVWEIPPKRVAGLNLCPMIADDSGQRPDCP